MALNEFEVTLGDGTDITKWYLIAEDAEHAAWSALELSKTQGYFLIDLRLSDEW